MICFGLGVYGTLGFGFLSVMLLFYPLAVILAGMLINSRAAFWMVAGCMLAYVVSGLSVGAALGDALPYLITFFFALLGIALLQWYAYSRLQQALAAQIEANQQLQAEIIRRQHAEQAQEEMDATLRRLAENTTDLVAEIDPNGIFRYVSPSYKTTLGYDPHDLLGSNAFDLVHPDDLAHVLGHAQAAAADGKPRRVALRTKHSSGDYLYMEVSGNPIYDASGALSGFALSSRDIHLQKQAEFALQASERKFRNIIEALPMGVHIYFLDDAGNLIFSGYNPAADALLGIDHAALLNKPIEEAFPGLAETEIPERYRQIAIHGGVWRSERVDYSHHPIEGAYEVSAFQESPGRMVAVFSDITQRIRSAEALRVSEEKFSTAFMTSPDSVNINRLADGVYIDINQGFTRLMGYTREDVIGKSSLELSIWVDPNDRARLVKGLQEKGFVENLEARFRRKNGEIGVGLMSAKVIVINGEPCILSITRDITDRIQSELELRRAHALLEQAYEATLLGWARALELRERETANHSYRVVEQTLRMAKLLGCTEADLTHIKRGALLHDIGKLGVPDEILLKPGRLTPDEWVIMRQHPEFARALLEEIEYLRPSLDIPYCHHEKWDGSGYPQGLKEEQIPLAARIFAVVDVYDALTSNRPYRPAWSEAEARRYLIEQSGAHFDPRVVQVFLSLIDQDAAAPAESQPPAQTP